MGNRLICDRCQKEVDDLNYFWQSWDDDPTFLSELKRVNHVELCKSCCKAVKAFALLPASDAEGK